MMIMISEEIYLMLQKVVFFYSQNDRKYYQNMCFYVTLNRL